MTSRKVGASGTTRFTYDARTRLTSIDYPDPTPDVTLRYTRDDKLETLTRGAGSPAVVRTFDYDPNRNLVRENLSVDGLNFDIGFGYDANDQLASVRYPRTDTLVSYAPDALGRPTRLTLTTNASSETLLASVGFFPSGHLKSYTRSNGVTATVTQNARLWPSALVHAKAGVTLSSFAYAYDGRGNLTALTDKVEAAYSATLGYDPPDRLTTVTSGGFAGTIAYSATGNILTQKLSATRQLTYGYDASHRLSAVSGSLARSYAYDAYGNAIADGRSVFTYDDAANLIRAQVGSPLPADLTYTYDGRNTRVKVQRAGAPPEYSIYTAAGDLLAEYHQPTQVHSEYFYIAGQQVGRRDSVPADPNLTLATNLSAVPLSTPLTLTARVGTLAASGNVRFYDGQLLLGTKSLAGGSAAIQVPLGSGPHALRAVYDGDTYTAPAQVSLSIDVPQPVGPWLPAVLDLLLGDDDTPVSGTAAAASAAAGTSPIPEPPAANPAPVPAPLAAAQAAGYQFAPLTHIDPDVFGNPVIATDHTGAVLWKERYFPYGEKRIAGGSQTHRLSFHGKALDADTGLQYFGARHYDPQIGRFTGVDPVSFGEGNVHSFNRYAYGNNTPYKFRDPDGRAVETILDVVSLTLSFAQFRAEPNLVNGLGLGYDAIATVVPVLPAGVGSIRAGLKTADLV
jgi:RHS repeat-associated protein